MTRYQQLLQLIAQQKPKTIFEFGTWNGDRAIEMIKEAQKHNKDIRYGGVDLFEDATSETDAQESNVKPHFPVQEVYNKIKAATGLGDQDLKLIRCNSRELTLPLADAQGNPVDFVFIDGGHSVETIKHDFELAKNSKLIVLDDFYSKDEDGKCLDTEKLGCNKLIQEIKGGVLAAKDPVFVQGKKCGYVQMAVYPPPGDTEIRVKTRNVGSDQEIQHNIKISLSRYHSHSLSDCRVHGDTAIMASGGPSLEERLPDLIRLKLGGGTIFAVKSAHDRLINLGVVPDFCVLLDPRGHVKDFIESPHPDVHYMVASMCHPDVMQTLISKGANAWLYHAAVGAGEDNLLRLWRDPKQLFQPLIAGGCSSATRGLLIAWMMGFRKAALFGYDLCYKSEDEAAGNRLGKERVQISVKDGKCHFAKDGIWTDFEKVAQAGELAQMMRDRTVEIDVYGGVVASLLRGQIPRRPEFRRVFGKPRLAA